MAPHQFRVAGVRGPTMLGVLGAALLITALVVAVRWQDPAGRPPTSSAGPTGAGHGRRPQLPTWASRPPPTARPRGRLLPDPPGGGRRRLPPGAAASRRAGDRRGVPGADRPGLPLPLSAGRRPARRCGPLPGAAADLGAWHGATGTVRAAVPLRPGARVPLQAGGVHGAAGLPWR